MREPDPKSLERELLALRCRRGERAAWEELVGAFERPLFYYVRRMVRGSDEAWVVLQETWVRVFSSLATLEDPARLAPWLYAVARNTLKQHVAELANERQVPTDLADVQDPLTLDSAEHDPERVHAALAELPLLQREVIVLFFLDDLSLQAIAEVLNVPVGTVKSRLHHARRSLHEILSRIEARHER